MLPQLLAQECRDNGRRYCVVVFSGTEFDWTDGHPLRVHPIEKPGKLIKALKGDGFDTVTFAGAMRRPDINPLKLDAVGIKLSAAIFGQRRSGDDASLREIIRVFEAGGLDVCAAQDLVAGLVPDTGVLTQAKPDSTARSDSAVAAKLVATLGALDVGQGAVVVNGLCFGLETLQGTDKMLEFVATTRPETGRSKRAGVVFKAPKPTQDRRVDLPAVGVNTVILAHQAGLAGITVEAGGVMVLERDRVIAEANARGMFVWCRAAE